MLLIDDIVLAPYRGLMWSLRKIREQAAAELNGESERIRDTLAGLYRELEAGAITEEEFERREAILLDRLEALEEREESDEQREGDAGDSGGQE